MAPLRFLPLLVRVLSCAPNPDGKYAPTMTDFKNALRRVLPAPLVTAIKDYRARAYLAQYPSLSTQEAFTKIYEEGAWGKSTDANGRFFSGTGSHDAAVVTTYLAAVGRFLQSFPEKPDVVDLGCGDFNVGSQIRAHCGSYVACDIVESLIDFNRSKFNDLHVDFRVLDLAKDALPKAEVVFVRQVLQHLSNDKIVTALQKIAQSYRYLVLTEHVPVDAGFTHNVDKPSGPDTRLALRSGVVVTSPPFNLAALEHSPLCSVPEGKGAIVTTLYRLR
jgi:Methyltransferase domain